jgi:hypothetical protein
MPGYQAVHMLSIILAWKTVIHNVKKKRKKKEQILARSWKFDCWAITFLKIHKGTLMVTVCIWLKRQMPFSTLGVKRCKKRQNRRSVWSGLPWGTPAEKGRQWRPCSQTRNDRPSARTLPQSSETDNVDWTEALSNRLCVRVCVCACVRYSLCMTGKHISNVCNTLDNKAVLCLMSYVLRTHFFHKEVQCIYGLIECMYVYTCTWPIL